MEALIKDRFNEAVLQAAMQRYGIAPGKIRALDAFENFIYEFERDGRAYILRISHSLRRTEALVQGEMAWINFLAAGGVSVAHAIPAASGRLVELIEDEQGGAFLVSAFVKAPGQPPWDLWTPGLYETYGETIGRMHAVSKDYQPSRPDWRRPEWDDPLFEFVDRYLPESEGLARQKYQQAIRQIKKLPKDAESYGMIHQDAHGSNLFVTEAGQITLFDFDECAYGWFINEIAIVLFYIVQDAEDWPAFTQTFMTHFLRGYLRACPLEPAWLKEIPLFLKIREIELYAVMYRDFAVEEIDNEWCARFMRGRKAKIEQDLPFIDFDFMTLEYGAA